MNQLPTKYSFVLNLLYIALIYDDYKLYKLYFLYLAFICNDPIKCTFSSLVIKKKVQLHKTYENESKSFKNTIIVPIFQLWMRNYKRICVNFLTITSVASFASSLFDLCCPMITFNTYIFGRK